MFYFKGVYEKLFKQFMNPKIDEKLSLADLGIVRKSPSNQNNHNSSSKNQRE